MFTSSNYNINSTKVVFERFDDETVLINLESGNYYGLMDTARVILELISAGADNKNIIDCLADMYNIDQQIIEKEILEFIQLLLSEELIELKQDNLDVFDYKSFNLDFPLHSYKPPTMEIYSDMQDLILLDPIHDVSNQGWPKSKDENENEDSSKK